MRRIRLGSQEKRKGSEEETSIIPSAMLKRRILSRVDAPEQAEPPAPEAPAPAAAKRGAPPAHESLQPSRKAGRKRGGGNQEARQAAAAAAVPAAPDLLGSVVAMQEDAGDASAPQQPGQRQVLSPMRGNGAVASRFECAPLQGKPRLMPSAAFSLLSANPRGAGLLLERQA